MLWLTRISAIFFFFFCGILASCEDLEEAIKKLDHFKDIKYLRTPRDSQEYSSIWLEYEFNTGAGNREELVVTDISVDEYTNLPEAETKWQYLEINGSGYLIRTEKSTLFFYKLSLDNAPNTLSKDFASLSVEGSIVTFKVISLESFRSTSTPEIDVVAVLCVESDRGTSLQWYRLLDGNSFKFFWSWPVQKHTKDMEFIQQGIQKKLLLLNENEIRFGRQNSPIDIYGFNIDFLTNSFNFWLCQRTFAPKIFDIQVCSIYENIFLALQGASEVYLYEYKNTTEASIFQELQTIKSQDLKNFVCFESGYLQFLAISGPEAALFHFFEGEFQYNAESESSFDISEISWVRDVRLNTYRDESLLLIQLRNSTVIALAWQGLSFKKIHLPSNILDQFDISMATVVPKFGFILGNKFVRFQTKLKDLEHPIQHSTERLLSLQSLLNDSLTYQEKILNETRTRLEKSYLSKTQVTGVWNISTVNATNAVITDDVIYHSVTIGSVNLTREELWFDVNSYAEALRDLEGKLEEIDANLVEALDFDSKELNFDSEVEISGNINVTGSLNVEDLSVEFINDLDVMNDARYHDEVVVEGKRTFSSIEAENVTIYSLNGIPVKDIRFGDSMEDYGDVDFSKISRAEVKEHLFFDSINGVEWKTLMEDIVWKDEPKVIPGETVIEGTLTADTVSIDFLNNLRYPKDYVLVDSSGPAYLTGLKSFDELVVPSLKNVKFINDIDVEDFVVLHKDNVLNELITFENLEVDDTLQVDGTVTRMQEKEIKLLNETSNVSSNIIFSSLTVLGNVTFENALLDGRRLNFEDLLLKTEENVEITGTKTFLGNVGIGSNLTIMSGMINGHSMDDFVTLDTDQELPNLQKISSNVTFGNVTYGATKKLEAFLRTEKDCLKKIIIFDFPLIVDELSVDNINNTSYQDFARMLNETFQTASLENLKTETLRAEEIVPKVINGVEFANFSKHLAKSSIINEYTIDKLETDQLNVKFINGIPFDEIKLLKDQLSALIVSISDGNRSLESLQVTGKVSTNTINGQALENYLQENRMGSVIFNKNVSIKNLTILGSMNDLDFLERVSDTVQKTDRNITVHGHKRFNAVSCSVLEAKSLNGHLMENILDPLKEQVLTGPLTINGSLTILNNFNATGNIGSISYEDLISRFKPLGKDTYELVGNVRFYNNVSIENLFTNGTIQGTDFGSFLSTTVARNEDNVTVFGAKVFQGPVTFKGAFLVRDKLNDIDLKRFQKAVFVDRPFSVRTKLVFKDGVRIEEDIEVETEFQAKSLMGVDVNELRLDVHYLNRPTYIKETIAFTDVIFGSNIEVSKFNDFDMRLLIPLHTDQSIPVGVFRCRSIKVDEIRILGNINEENLKTMQENTFMLSGEQNITGQINFRGHVNVRRDFNAFSINGIDPKRIIPLNSKTTLTGNFVFEKPIVFNQGLRVGYLNGINPGWWDGMAVRTNNITPQTISGKWTVLGNVYFENGASGPEFLNGTNITALVDTLATRHLEMDALITETEENLKSICDDLNQLKHFAEKQVYKFSSFDYLQIIEFDNRIVSLHYFDLDGSDYLLVNYDTCHMHVYLFTGTKFELLNSVPNFGVVDRWSTFRHLDTVYFLTSGPDSCGRGPVNLWKLEEDNFIHVLSLGRRVDTRRMNQDAFLTLINKNGEGRSVEEIHEELEKSFSSLADEDDVKIVLKGDEMLLTSRQTMSEESLDGLHYNSVGEYYKRPERINFSAGLLEKDMFLYYDEEISKDHIFICSNNVKQKKILQTIKVHRPSSFTILNFEGSIETLLVFVENGRSLQIYEYKGIQGFLYRDTIRINVDKLFSIKIRKYSNLAKRHCLALIHENRLTILQANMYGEKLDMEALSCSEL
ncbi:female sterile (1) Nasrat [Calliopsis andreniformis]|uniref:female sterile (1) Nasrat n=1 Tax=Calliopsis andreniformis TaxID=337506 RepID=UPI003FCD4939